MLDTFAYKRQNWRNHLYCTTSWHLGMLLLSDSICEDCRKQRKLAMCQSTNIVFNDAVGCKGMQGSWPVRMLVPPWRRALLGSLLHNPSWAASPCPTHCIEKAQLTTHSNAPKWLHTVWSYSTFAYRVAPYSGLIHCRFVMSELMLAMHVTKSTKYNTQSSENMM